MEIRLHGRGGQGGVTCAKILAAAFAELGKSVQAFGDYASERSGAPVRAYTRVSDGEITSRNKVYDPDHVIVLDAHLLGPDTIAGLAPGGSLLVNSGDPPETIARRFPGFRTATVDATEIARRHKIGSRSVVIVNTTIAGAAARLLGIPFERLESVYRRLGFLSNLEAAREAAEKVNIHDAEGSPAPPPPAPTRAEVRPLTEHTSSVGTGIRTGAWRSQQPKYVEHLAPCNAWCPAGNDVVGFIQALAGNGVETAAGILAASNPLAGTCGRVCPAPCMEGCNRAEYDGSVNIRGLERWVADHSAIARPRHPTVANPRRIAIIGGGPAGLAAAYEIARAGHRAAIFEGEDRLGGLLLTGIPEYRLPEEVVSKEIDAILKLGVEAHCGRRLGKEDLEPVLADHDALIVAVGLQKLRALPVPGHDFAGVEQGIDWLRRLNLGDEVRCSGRVVVLGGGNTAIDCARSARRAGATEVVIAYRRSEHEMPAIAEEIEQAREEGIRFLFQRQPVAFTGRPDAVAGVVLAEVEMGDPDETGRRRPIVGDRRETHDCDQVLLALGQSADLDIFPTGWKLEDGVLSRDGQALPVLLAGDLATGEGTVTHAVGSGRRSARLALRQLGETIAPFERPPRDHSVPATDIRVDHFARTTPSREKIDAVADRVAGFAEVSAGLADALESHRCFSCGHCISCDTCLVYCPEGSIHRAMQGYEVDYGYCKGCGICVTECPRVGMEMVDL